jgi:LPXTG-motif cell wall-anchored protein
MRSRLLGLHLVAAAVLLLAVPGGALAHSELESSDPADGAVLDRSPTTISGDFSEPVDPARSSLELRGPDGARIATGGVLAGGPATRMAIDGIAPLADGRYEVRWTTVTSDDDGVERGTFSFAVAVAAGPSPAAPTAAPETPARSPDPDAPATGGVGDLVLPLAALLLLVGGGTFVLLLRRR